MLSQLISHTVNLLLHKINSAVVKYRSGQTEFTCAHSCSLGTFRSEDEGDYEYEFSVLSMCIRLGARHFSKCACPEQKTRTRSRPRPPI